MTLFKLWLFWVAVGISSKDRDDMDNQLDIAIPSAAISPQLDTELAQPGDGGTPNERDFHSQWPTTWVFNGWLPQKLNHPDQPTTDGTWTHWWTHHRHWRFTAESDSHSYAIALIAPATSSKRLIHWAPDCCSTCWPRRRSQTNALNAWRRNDKNEWFPQWLMAEKTRIWLAQSLGVVWCMGSPGLWLAEQKQGEVEPNLTHSPKQY